MPGRSKASRSSAAIVDAQHGRAVNTTAPAAAGIGSTSPDVRTYLIFGDIEGKLDVLRVGAPSATARAAITSTS